MLLVQMLIMVILIEMLLILLLYLFVIFIVCNPHGIAVPHLDSSFTFAAFYVTVVHVDVVHVADVRDHFDADLDVLVMHVCSVLH